MMNGSTAQDGRGLVDQRGWEGKTRKRVEEIVRKKKEKGERMGDHPRKILLIKKQICYIPSFIFYPVGEEICFHDDIVTRISTG
jgi:hypothetical protein